MPTTMFSIPGIHCEGCAKLIKDVSLEFPTITGVDVDVKAKKVSIEHDQNFDLQSWKQEIESLGDNYKVYSVS